MSGFFEHIFSGQGLGEHGLIFLLIFAGILLLLTTWNIDAAVKRKFELLGSYLNEKDRKIRSEKRKKLYEVTEKLSFRMKLERELDYSGLKRRFPSLTGDKLLILAAAPVIAGLIMCINRTMRIPGLIIAVAAPLLIYVIIRIGRLKNMRKVSEELPKFLDFLGSYSITSGEIMGILSQISVYLDSPLRDVLEECSAEGRISGDADTALLAMAEKIEHPQFKQLIRNIEITARYSADFTTLVADSRKSLREYLAQAGERRAMLREAGINMGLLLAMSVVVLVIVNMLIDGKVWNVLLGTPVGYLALGGMAVIFFLFFMQAMSIDK